MQVGAGVASDGGQVRVDGKRCVVGSYWVDVMRGVGVVGSRGLM